MTSTEAIKMYGSQAGYIFKLRNNGAYLTMGTDIVVGLDGYMPLHRLNLDNEYTIKEVWQMNPNPGEGFKGVLSRFGVSTGSTQATKICDIENINPKFLMTRFFVGTKSKEIQEKLFRLGYKWASGDREIRCTDEPFLYIDRKGNITWTGGDYEYFESQTEYRKVMIWDILDYSEK